VTPTTPTTPTTNPLTGITGAVLAVTGNPYTFGTLALLVIIGGYALWSRKKGGKPEKVEKTDRKYI
jgi:hypothetical protein